MTDTLTYGTPEADAHMARMRRAYGQHGRAGGNRVLDALTRVEPMVHRTADSAAMAAAAVSLLDRIYVLQHRGRPLTVRERADLHASKTQLIAALRYLFARHQDPRVRALVPEKDAIQ